MGGLIPLTDASRRPVNFPIVTILIIIVNFLVFGLELTGGESFVLKWAAIPANVTTGHRWITVLTAMFMHGSWSHILGNMVFLWAFGTEMEDAMNPIKYLAFYLSGGLVAMLAQINGSELGRQRSNCSCHGRVFGHLSHRSDSSTAVHTGLRANQVDSGSATNWRLVFDSVV